ncbi:MAG: aminotransferase class I/II-fold pyridoxal phosphate-dependent enzyme [Vicinamibacterales bacterium]
MVVPRRRARGESRRCRTWYDRTILLHTFSKSYAVTGVRMGYYAIKDPVMRARAMKIVLYTTSNVSSLTARGHRRASRARRRASRSSGRSSSCAATCSTRVSGGRRARDILSGNPPAGAFYAFSRSTRSG